VLHQPRLARRSQLPPQAGAWFSNSPLQFSSMRSGELLHTGKAASTPVRASSLPRRTAPPVSAVPHLPCLWARLPCLRQRHAGRDRSRVRGERRVGGQLLRVRRHHRGEVEHGRPPPLGSHEGHRRGDDCAFRWFLCFFVSSEDLRRPRKVSAGHEEDKGIRGRPFRLCTPSPAGGKFLF
jgi:hypothetical protein